MRFTGLAIIVAIALGFVAGYEYHDRYVDPELPPEQEFEAYRLCMQSASTTRCTMTPQDFVRYYELKYQLENDNE